MNPSWYRLEFIVIGMIDFDLASELAVLVLGKIDGAGGCTVGDAFLMINFCVYYLPHSPKHSTIVLGS